MYILTKYHKIYFNPEFATTNVELRDGMMGRTFTKFNALVFIFDNFGLIQNISNKKKLKSFWMKNCIIPLDVIFATKISDNIYQINKIDHNCPPCKSNNCPTYKGYADIIIELLGNTCRLNNISVGDKIIF